MAAKKKASKKKSAPAKKSATKKRATKKSATKKSPTKKSATKKSATKKSATKKSAPAKKKKKSATKKSATKSAKKKAPSTKSVAAEETSSVAAPETPAVEAAPVAPRPETPPDPTEELAQALGALASDKKAEDIVILKVTDLTSYADCFVLASAPSERQVQAIARNVAEEMKKAGRMALGTEGLEQGHWVLVDYGAVVLHVFLSSARQYYDLEGFWADAPRIEFDEARGKETFNALCAAFDEKRAAANE